ncbi:MAG: hypothetical protein AAF993_21350, partial [Pseudomonadota bacterium]
MAVFSAAEICRRLDEAGIVFSLDSKNAEEISDPQLLANHVNVPSQDNRPCFEQTFATPFQITD